MTTTVYARQVPPEYMESPRMVNDNCDGVEIFGNRHYKGITSALFDRLPGILDDLAAEWDNLQAGQPYAETRETWADILTNYAPPEGRPNYTRDERKNAWPALLKEYNNLGETPDNLAAALSLITGRTWDTCTLRGCCQREWQNCIYDTSIWTGHGIECLEMEYFNTGTEWTFEEEAEGVCCSVYCYEWSADGIRREIAAAAGVDPEAVTLQKFTGYTKTATYEEV